MSIFSGNSLWSGKFVQLERQIPKNIRERLEFSDRNKEENLCICLLLYGKGRAKTVIRKWHVILGLPD